MVQEKLNIKNIKVLFNLYNIACIACGIRPRVLKGAFVPSGVLNDELLLAWLQIISLLFMNFNDKFPKRLINILKSRRRPIRAFKLNFEMDKTFGESCISWLFCLQIGV